MIRKILSPMKLLAFVALGSLVGWWGYQNLALGDIASAPAAHYVWTAPVHGSPVDHYIVQVLVNDVDILTIDQVPSETVDISVIYGNKYRVRAAAVDGDDIQGPFSPWSDPYTPELAPPGF